MLFRSARTFACIGVHAAVWDRFAAACARVASGPLPIASSIGSPVSGAAASTELFAFWTQHMNWEGVGWRNLLNDDARSDRSALQSRNSSLTQTGNEGHAPRRPIRQEIDLTCLRLIIVRSALQAKSVMRALSNMNSEDPYGTRNLQCLRLLHRMLREPNF